MLFFIYFQLVPLRYGMQGIVPHSNPGGPGSGGKGGKGGGGGVMGMGSIPPEFLETLGTAHGEVGPWEFTPVSRFSGDSHLSRPSGSSARYEPE